MRIESQLPQTVEKYISNYCLVPEPGVLLVGVSGGPDSVCLLHILNLIKDKLGVELYVAHLNHELRGEESKSDAAYVSELARSLGLKAAIESRDVRGYQEVNSCSLEEAAREVRYAFFAELAHRVSAFAVAVGHTADDQAETLLMNLIRGSGLTGLRGMKPLTERCIEAGRPPLLVLRPLLEVPRSQVEAYCQAVGLHTRDDSSNYSSEYLRNRIRSEIIPRLREYNPEIVASLVRTAQAVSQDLEYIDEEVDRVFDSVVEKDGEGGLSLNNLAFNRLPLALRRQLLRSALAQLAGGLRDIEMVHIEKIIGVMNRPAGRELDLPHALKFYGDYERSFISRGGNPLDFLVPLKEEVVLVIPGETRIPGWKVRSEVMLSKPDSVSEGELVAFFDLDLTGNELTVRGRRDGDRFQPLGMEGSRKLQDFMVDAKIPRISRERVPLVCSRERIIWVVGWRMDHRTRVTEHTQRVLRLEFETE